MRKFIGIFTIVVIVVLAVFIYWRYYRPFGDGTKAGELNYIVKKGYVFKTYEGKLIQSGLRSKTAGTVASYEFEFSVEDDSVANNLMMNSGKTFVLHYKEYLGVIPWRGHSKYVVDKVINMKE